MIIYSGTVSREDVSDDSQTFNQSYLSLVSRLREVKGGKAEGLSITEMWKWSIDVPTGLSDDTYTFFKATPPIQMAKTSNRILMVGTNYECSTFRELISKEGINALERLLAENGIIEDPKFLEHIEAGNLDYCSHDGLFWEGFFGRGNFLDEPDTISLPAFIITTGHMRSYAMGVGSTIPVSERLKEIADPWGIPLYLVSENQLKSPQV